MEISDRYSPFLRQLVKDMLQVDPLKRPSVKDLISRPFLKSELENVISDISKKHKSWKCKADNIYDEISAVDRLSSSSLKLDPNISISFVKKKSPIKSNLRDSGLKIEDLSKDKDTIGEL